jgi:hypothetical protein
MCRAAARTHNRMVRADEALASANRSMRSRKAAVGSAAHTHTHIHTQAHTYRSVGYKMYTSP